MKKIFLISFLFLSFQAFSQLSFEIADPTLSVEVIDLYADSDSDEISQNINSSFTKTNEPSWLTMEGKLWEDNAYYSTPHLKKIRPLKSAQQSKKGNLIIISLETDPTITPLLIQ